MLNTRGLDDFPADAVDQMPREVRHAFLRARKSAKALRLYARRGWNPSAIQHQYDRETQNLRAVIDEWEHRERNPRLF